MTTNDVCLTYSGTTIAWPFTNTFVTTNGANVSLLCDVKQEKEETAMSIEQNTLDYLSRRVESTFYGLHSELADTFNLYKDNKPKTYKELIAAIKGDKFKLDAKRTKRIDEYFSDGDEDEDCFYSFRGSLDGIIWDGPQPDRKGYDKAIEDLSKAKTDTMDTIRVITDEEKRLAALKAFEAWVPSNAPKN